MNEINNPQIIKFVNEVVRVRAEELRALKAKIATDLQTWYAISSLVPNDVTLLNDGRDSEGVSRLTGADITSLMATLSTFDTKFGQTGVAAVIDKPCVRVFRAE
jgi:hypothetical protein